MIDLNKFKIANPKLNFSKLTIKGREYIVRSISKEEYFNAIAVGKENSSDLIVQLAIVYPDRENFDVQKIPAGVPDILAEQVLKISLLDVEDAIPKYLEIAREKTKTLERQSFMLIKIAFPEVTLDNYNKMTWPEICEYIAMAEEMNNIKQNALISALSGVEFNYNLNIKPLEEVAKKEKKKTIETVMEDYLGGDPALLSNMPNIRRVPNDIKVFLGGRHWRNQGVADEINRTIKLLREKNR